MKEDNEIDKLFKEKLGNLGSQGIPQSFLDDINDRLDNLPEEKKKRRGLWLWFIPAFGIISGGLYFALSGDSEMKKMGEENSELTVAVDQPKGSEQLTEGSNNNTGNNNKVEPDIDGPNDNTAQVDEEPVGIKAASDNNSKGKGSVPESENGTQGRTLRTSENNTSKIQTSTEGKTIDAGVKAGDNKVNSKVSSFKKNAIGVVTQKKTTTKNTEADIKTVEGDNGEVLSKNKSIDSVTGTGTNEIAKKAVAPKPIAAADSSAIKTDSINSKDELTIKDSKSDSLNTVSVDSVKKDPDYTESKALVLSSLQVSAGAQKALSLFDFKNLVMPNKVPDHSEPATGIDIGLQAVYKKDRLFYSTGFNFNQWTEHFNYNQSITTTTTETNVIGFQQITSYPVSHQNIGHTDPFGNFVLDSVITVTDTLIQLQPITADETVVHNDSVSKKGVDKYNYISIPLFIGFQMGSNAFTVLPKIGGSIGVPVRLKSIYTNDLIETKQNISAPILVNLELSIDLTVNYRSFGFSIIPFYRRSMYYFNASADLTNKYSGAGVKAGISYYFK